MGRASKLERMPGSNQGRHMDLQLYYQKIRAIEERIGDEFPIVISNESADGGKGGKSTEVPRRIAAKLVVEGLARLASADETKTYRDQVAEARRLAEQMEQASRVQLTVLSTADLKQLKGQTRNSKD
jgi:hypothetical protein